MCNTAYNLKADLDVLLRQTACTHSNMRLKSGGGGGGGGGGLQPHLPTSTLPAPLLLLNFAHEDIKVQIISRSAAFLASSCRPECKSDSATVDSIPGDRSDTIVTLSPEKEPDSEQFFGVSSSSCNRDVRSPEIFRSGEEPELLEEGFA